MKNQTKQQIVEESFYNVEEDVEVQELVETKRAKAEKVRAQKDAQARMERYLEYMWGGMCFAHDKNGCPECMRAAEGECPSALEESTTPSGC
jgi:hypothetical protein